MDLNLEADKRIRTSNRRMTAQRRLILNTLNKLDIHPTADELLERVQE